MLVWVGRIQADGLEATGFWTEAKQTGLSAAFFGSPPIDRQKIGPVGARLTKH